MTCKCKMVFVTERKSRSSRRDGSSSIPGYTIWVGIRYRCNPSNRHAYQHLYAGKGVGICEQWANSFHLFKKDMGPRPSLSYSVDRIDGNLGYCPHNTRWASPKTQSQNRITTFNPDNSVYQTRSGGFEAYYSMLGKRMYLGTFSSRKLAKAERLKFHKSII